MNARKAERVSRAICNAARLKHHPHQCPICEGTDWHGSKCILWPEFVIEAEAAERAM